MGGDVDDGARDMIAAYEEPARSASKWGVCVAKFPDCRLVTAYRRAGDTTTDGGGVRIPGCSDGILQKPGARRRLSAPSLPDALLASLNLSFFPV